MTDKEFLAIIEESVEAEPGTVQLGDTLAQVQNWKSLAIMVFISLVDEELDVVVSPKAIAKATTVADLKAAVERQVG